MVQFVSSPDWESFAGVGTSPGALPLTGPDLGPAKDVCLNADVPANCPVMGAVVYGYESTNSWGAGAALPEAHWIWRADVTLTGLADLQIGVFEKTFVLGANPTGTIEIGADDFAEVFVNGVPVGSVGSTSNVVVANAAQTSVSTFDLGPMLDEGSNTIAVLGQNGPASFAGGCGGTPCLYSQNPAGVVFAGTLEFQ